MKTPRQQKPLHDEHGDLAPELDTRWVSSKVLGAYLGVGHHTIYRRAKAGMIGDPNDPQNSGVRVVLPVHQGSDRLNTRYQFVPALIWLRNRWGRYSDDQFHPFIHGDAVATHSAARMLIQTFASAIRQAIPIMKALDALTKREHPPGATKRHRPPGHRPGGQ